MKKFIGIILCICLSNIICLGQNRSATVCRLGFTYETSKSEHWGKDMLIIKNVIPYSPAELAGLKSTDLIEAIDGVAIENLTEEDFPILLNPSDKSEVTLTIRTIDHPEKFVRVRKECKKANAITEDQLAAAFNMYSLESTSVRTFTCPFKTTPTTDPIDFGNFRTFTFSPVEEDNSSLDIAINSHISKELTQKGLIQENENADLLIETYYFFDRNPNYKGTNRLLVEKEPIYRYDLSHNKMVTLPFLSYMTAESEAEYLLQLGVRLVDMQIVPGRILWECEANELLDSSYRLEDYARIHIPLMFMQYPYVKYNRNVPYTVDKKLYNYTGIQYDIDRLEFVSDVDRNSPAHAAGVRPGDVIERIGKHKMNLSSDAFTSAYRKFISSTMQFRDPKTQFTDANGFNYCMFWDTFKYTQVADALQHKDANAAFSYLFYFAPYINPSGNNACVFQIKRGKEKQEITIRPTIRTEVSVEIK